MNCQEARELSSDYLDRRLPVDKTTLFEKHLGDCSACPQELEALRRTIFLIGSLDEIEPAADFLARVHEKIEKGERGKRIRAWLFEPFKVKVPLEATALVLVGVTAFYLYQRLPELSREELAVSALKKAEVAREKSQADIVDKAAESRESYRSAEAESGAQPTTEASGTKASPAPGMEARNEVAAPAPQVETHEIVVENIADYESKVQALLAKVDGRILVRGDISEAGLLLTVELPQSRQGEFVAGLKEEVDREAGIAPLEQGLARDSQQDIQQKSARSADRAGGAASESSLSSRLRSNEPRVTLRIRILPKN